MLKFKIKSYYIRFGFGWFMVFKVTYNNIFIYIHIFSYYKLFLDFNVCLNVMLDSFSMFIYIHILYY
jgi:hypothetical protein